MCTKAAATLMYRDKHLCVRLISPACVERVGCLHQEEEAGSTSHLHPCRSGCASAATGAHLTTAGSDSVGAVLLAELQEYASLHLTAISNVLTCMSGPMASAVNTPR